MYGKVYNPAAKLSCKHLDSYLLSNYNILVRERMSIITRTGVIL